MSVLKNHEASVDCRGLTSLACESGLSRRPEYQCPRCRATELSVTVVFSGMATCRFQPGETAEVVVAEEMESEIPKLGKCACRKCGWKGLAQDALNQRCVTSVSAAGLSESELLQLVRNLRVSRVTPAVCEQLSSVIDELLSLRRQRQAMQ